MRRLRLRVSVKLMLAIGFAGLCYVLLAAFLSVERPAGRLDSLRVHLGGMQPGDTRHLRWSGRPVLVHRRTQAEIAALERASLPLVDPDSRDAVQPSWVDSAGRSRRLEWFVAIALGTDFGCPVRYLPPSDRDFMQQPWFGGYVDECRGSRYDPAGRVYRSQYADRNLMVPEYQLIGETLILGGHDP